MFFVSLNLMVELIEEMMDLCKGEPKPLKEEVSSLKGEAELLKKEMTSLKGGLKTLKEGLSPYNCVKRRSHFYSSWTECFQPR